MANSLIAFKEEEIRKITAISICEDIGIDLSTYLRICISRLIQERGLPFSINIEERQNKGFEAMIKANRISKQQGLNNMTLDEINAEINEARKGW